MQIVSYGMIFYRPRDRQIMSPVAPNGPGGICESFILRSRGCGLLRGEWEV